MTDPYIEQMIFNFVLDNEPTTSQAILNALSPELGQTNVRTHLQNLVYENCIKFTLDRKFRITSETE